ncbi:hypothetical protein FOZ60_010464 [Perkinsus olseni]|uniref:Neutral alpha-glucosidase AB n=2 Tax=Perkinsus olseni TaxID=32597 RepID=A0A7J6NF05_PEROL|nr:hypothetical protein FOZ60_010464 [Perkinsus olseni]
MVRILALLCASTAIAVYGEDARKFRRCDQGSFCRRFRKWVDRAQTCQAGEWQGAWYIDSEVSRPTKTEPMRLELHNRYDSSTLLQLEVQLHKDIVGRCGIVRVTVDERDSIFPRYRIPKNDVVMDDSLPIISWAEVEYEQDDRGVTLLVTTDPRHRCKVHIGFDPVQIDVSHNDKPVISVNKDGLMNFEVYRRKAEGSIQAKAEGDTSVADATEIDTSDLWQETFNSFVDTKPRGPAAVGVDVTMVASRHAYGLAGHSTSLDLPRFEDPYRIYNTDVFEYPVDSPTSLYGGSPFLLSFHYKDDPDHEANFDQPFVSGLLWNNPSETFVKVDTPHHHEKEIQQPLHDAKSWFLSESGIIDMFILTGLEPYEVLYKYHTVTGFPSTIPMFALGKHQSRWNYDDVADVKTVNQKFDANDVPLDVLWLDIEHTDGKRYFTWDKDRFADPQEMLESVVKTKRKMVAIVDPHIKVDDDYSVYERFEAEKAFVQSKEGSPFVGSCWPGNSKYPDFSDVKVRAIWSELFNFTQYKGSSEDLYIWNDMNEPSVFDGPEMTMPRDVVHHSNVEHRDLHNLYGMYVHRASYEGMLARSQGKRRPFVLSRSFFTGSHRYGPIWTGDNMADFVHLAHSVPMLLSMAVNGMSFVGADVPGFFGNPTNELFIRWHQLGALAYPFYRAHAHLDTLRREPWMLGPEALEHVRGAVSVRYTLMPMWYTLFMEYSLGGRPVIRPLWFDNHDDINTFSEATQNTHIMVGDDILVKAVSHSVERSMNDHVYLPQSRHAHDGWYDFYTFDWKTGGLDHELRLPAYSVPMYMRAGSIISRKMRRRRSTQAMDNDPYTVFVNCAIDPAEGGMMAHASGRLFIDAGDGYEHLKGEFLYMKFDYRYRTLKAEPLSIPLHDTLDDKGRPTRIHGKLSGWPQMRLGVERLVFVGSTVAPDEIKYIDSTGEQDLLFTITDMGLSHPPRFHIVVKRPPITLGKYDWRIELRGLNFAKVQKHQEMASMGPSYGTGGSTAR